MLRAFQRLIGVGARVLQLSLELESRPPVSAADLKRRLARRGLDESYSVKLTNNRTVVVSFNQGEVRLHHGYLTAPEHVLDAVVDFVQGRSRKTRLDARRQLVAYRLPELTENRPQRPRPPERTHPADERLVGELIRSHADFNESKFGGELKRIPIRVSRRMKSRLGHYTWRGKDGSGAEIVISRRHIRRHGWDEALHTLLHEMVHQWQDETGRKVDHGAEFRAKARAVGIAPKARRDVA